MKCKRCKTNPLTDEESVMGYCIKCTVTPGLLKLLEDSYGKLSNKDKSN